MSPLDFAPQALEEWLADATGQTADITLAPLRGGGSCDMFTLERGDMRWVLRRAPLASVAATAHDVVREYQVIEALGGSEVRVPQLLACCDDATVVGAPFYIMRYVDGEVIRRGLPQQYCDSPETQPAIGEEIIDALVELHDFDWRNSAMATLGRPEHFLQRQVTRWMSQLEGYRNRDMAGVDEVATWLDANRPSGGTTR